MPFFHAAAFGFPAVKYTLNGFLVNIPRCEAKRAKARGHPACSAAGSGVCGLGSASLFADHDPPALRTPHGKSQMDADTSAWLIARRNHVIFSW